MMLFSKKTKPFVDVFESSKHGFNYLPILIFFLWGAIGIYRHAMWRDELNVWLISRNSFSIPELFQNMEYEGHPSLWYICLYLLKQLVDNPVAMQIFHLAIATANVYIFSRYSPFTRWQKTLFIFGYFPFYEYLTISRNYAIGLFFILLFCTLFALREKGYILLAIVLALMANTNAYCLFISLALGLALVVDRLISRKTNNIKSGNIIASIAIFLTGIIAAVLTILPPSNSTSQGGTNLWYLYFDFTRLTQAIARIWNAYIVVLIPGDSQQLSLLFFSIVSLFLIAFVSTIFIKKPVVLFFYLFATLEIVVFNYIKFLGVFRHYGHHYIVLVVSLWLSSYYVDVNWLNQRIFKTIGNWIKFVDRQKKIAIAIILSAQLAGGLVAFSRDVLVPYSAGRETANYIKSHDLGEMFVVGSRDINMATISGYLHRELYYPETQAMGSFTRFNNERKEVDADTVLQQVSQLVRQKNTDILLILNYRLEKSRDDIAISSIASFENSVIASERYYLYKIKATN
ncbi:MAG: hypothetical protein KME17_27725 [Cyanosarcina radialis HA8281-LM2]|jgi:hypothetical protein|nr:hypothetical protein [Cyanosarcina radialis HA8281-LM2]